MLGSFYEGQVQKTKPTRPARELPSARYHKASAGGGKVVGMLAGVALLFFAGQIVNKNSALTPVGGEALRLASEEFSVRETIAQEANAARVIVSTGRKTGRCPAKRADIVDRHGQILATDLLKYGLELKPGRYGFESEDERRALAAMIVEIVPDVPENRVLKLLKRQGGQFPLSAKLSEGQRRQLQDLPDQYSPLFQLIEKRGRVYPKGALFVHLVGTVDSDNCPKSGVELSLNHLIADRNQPLRLSVDESYQFVLRKALLKQIEATGASAAMGKLINVHTGAVVAEVSLPDSDPNQRRYLSNKNPEAFRKAEPNRNRQERELGSVMKPICIASALEEGLRLDTQYPTREELWLDQMPIVEDYPKNWDMNMTEIFVYSSNRGISQIALDMGYRRQIGFLNLMGLKSRDSLNKPAHKSDSAIATRCFGYGFTVNLSRLARAYAILLNGGFEVELEYLAGAVSQPGSPIVSGWTSERMRRLMLTNVVSEVGTGRRAYRPGLNAGGKTGTAKVYKTGQAGYGESTLATFIGGFPMDDPKYVIAVSLEGAKDPSGEAASGGSTAAPAAGDVAQFVASQEMLLRTPAESKKFEQRFVLPHRGETVRVAGG